MLYIARCSETSPVFRWLSLCMQYPHAYTSSFTLYYINLGAISKRNAVSFSWFTLTSSEAWLIHCTVKLYQLASKLCILNSNWNHSNFKLHFHILLTGACCVDSYIYSLGKIHCIKYLTMVDSCHSTSPAMHKYYHLTSGSVEVPQCTCTENSSSIGEEPVPYCSPDFTSSIRRSATSSFVSYAEQGICTFTNVLQGD